MSALVQIRTTPFKKLSPAPSGAGGTGLNDNLDAAADLWDSVQTKGSGTVTSVGLAAPAIFAVTNSPVSGAGTLTLTLATQAANLVFAGPTNGADAAPAFRALVAADIPALTLAKISNAGTMASQNANAVAITGGSATGLTSIGATAASISTLTMSGGGTIDTDGGSVTTGSVVAGSATVSGTINVSGDALVTGAVNAGSGSFSGTLTLGTVAGAITHSATKVSTGVANKTSTSIAYDDSGTNTNTAYAFYPTFNYTTPVSTTTSAGVLISAYLQSVHASSTNYLLRLGTNTASVGTGTHTDVLAVDSAGVVTFNADTSAQLWRPSASALRTNGSFTALGGFVAAGTSYFTSLDNGSNNNTLVFGGNPWSTAGSAHRFANTWTNSSGIGIELDLAPTFNQTSTATAKVLRISPLLTAVGSGGCLLLDIGTNSSGSGAGTHTTVSSVDSAGGWVIGSGQRLKKVLSATATLDFPNIAAGGYQDLTVSVTGAAVGDVVSIGAPNGSVDAGVQFTGWVSAADTVTVRAANHDGSGHDPASGTFRATVLNF